MDSTSFDRSKTPNRVAAAALPFDTDTVEYPHAVSSYVWSRWSALVQMFRRFANSAVRGVRMIPRLSVSVQSGASILSRSTTPALRAVRAESAIRSSLQSGSSVLAAIRRRWVSTQTVAPAAPNTNTSNSATAAAAAADAATGSQSNTAKAANTTDAAGAGGGDSGSVSDSGARQKKRGHRKAQDVPSTTADKTGGAVPQTIIPPLPPGSLPPATAEELPAAEMEGVRL